MRTGNASGYCGQVTEQEQVVVSVERGAAKVRRHVKSVCRLYRWVLLKKRNSVEEL
jgi:hypothetical protein